MDCGRTSTFDTPIPIPPVGCRGCVVAMVPAVCCVGFGDGEDVDW